MSGDYLNDDAPEFLLAHQVLDEAFEKISQTALKVGNSRGLYGEMSETGEFPLEYSIQVDSGAAQHIFHPNDQHNKVENARITHTTVSDMLSVAACLEAVEFVTVCLDVKMLSANIHVIEYFTLEKRDGIPNGYLDIDYLGNDEKAIRTDTMTPSMDDTAASQDDFLDVVEGNTLALRRPLLIEELEAMQLLAETCRQHGLQ